MLIMGCLSLVVAAALAVTDYRTGKMPNWITLGSLLVAVGVQGLVGGRAGITLSVLGAVVVGFVPVVLFFVTKGRAIGGGDVKALAATGAWLGPTAGLEAEMLGFCSLAVFALAREFVRGRGALLLRRSLRLALPRSGTLSSSRDESNEMLEVRFGPALFLGTFVVSTARLSEMLS